MFSIVAPQVRGKCAEDNIFAANNRAVALADEIGNDKVINGTVGSILDEEGEAIVLAEAIWILMDTKKMLPMKVSKEIADIYVEKDADTTVRINRKIDDNGEWKQQESIEVTKQYLDSNNHVNNTVYALWSEDVLSENVNVKEVRIDYRKAAMFKETIQVFTQQQENIFKVKYIKPDGEVAALVEMILQKQEEK